jgi:transposase
MTGRVWARRGTRPRVEKQTEYDYVYVFGAVCPSTGGSVALLLPQCNTEMMNLFLEALSREIPDDQHVALIVDNAGWHRAKALRLPENISLVFLPPYSPELNPIERVWLYAKNHFLCNRVFSDYEDLLDAGQDALRRMDKDLIRSICEEPWMNSWN